MAFDEVGQADTAERKVDDLRARLQAARRRRHRPAGHHLRPQYLRRRHRHRRAPPLRARLHRGGARDPRALPRRPHLGRPVEPQLLVPRQRAGAPRDAQRVPLSRDPRRHGHGDRQRRPARRLRRDRPRASRGVRGRHPRPPRRCDRAAGRRWPSASAAPTRPPRKGAAEWRWLPVGERLSYALVKGIDADIVDGHRGSAASRSRGRSRSSKAR